MCLAVTAPIWAPVLALLYHLFIILIWDVDNPDPVKRRGPIKHLFPMIRVIGWDVLVQGLLQPVACLGISFVVCPILALLLTFCKTYLIQFIFNLKILNYSYSSWGFEMDSHQDERQFSLPANHSTSKSGTGR